MFQKSILAPYRESERKEVWQDVYFESNQINKSERIDFLWAQVIFCVLKLSVT